MNGREFESRNRDAMPSTTIGSKKVIDLSLSEKQDLALFSGTPAYAAILKLMELQLIEARDAAILTDPAEPAKQIAAINIAHAMAKCFLGLKQRMEYLVAEVHGEIKKKQVQLDMEDHEKLEEIILGQSSGGY